MKALRVLFQFALEEGLVESDPTIGVKNPRYYTEGHHTWTACEVKQFQDCHPLGTQARLAMSLMLYTACRRGDVVRLGPQHVRNGRLQFRQAKNEGRHPIDISIPIHNDLQLVIDRTAPQHFDVSCDGVWQAFFCCWLRQLVQGQVQRGRS